MDTLIIKAELSEPPSETLPFRFLTQESKTTLHLDILIQSHKSMIDSYYHYLKNKGMLDYVEQIISLEEQELGIRLDTELNFPFTVLTKSITFVNTPNLLGQIKLLKYMPVV